MEDPRFYKLLLVKSIIKFLTLELTNPELDDEQRATLEVAIQCIESVYCMEGHRNDADALDLLDLVQKALMANQQEKEVTDEDKVKAETLKNEGNEEMKAQRFSMALLKYSEAIALNPHNAVYFCNRAAAYSRLQKHEEAIEDCKMALKLSPNYGKAYGRLGIAYSSLQNFEEAKTAYTAAIELEPENASYRENYDRAERLLAEQQTGDPRMLHFQRLINSPNVVNVASQMLNDPSFRSVVSEIMHSDGRSPNENINVLLEAGQRLAARVESADPRLAETLRSFDLPDIGPQGAAGEDQPVGDGQDQDSSESNESTG